MHCPGCGTRLPDGEFLATWSLTSSWTRRQCPSCKRRWLVALGPGQQVGVYADLSATEVKDAS